MRGEMRRAICGSAPWRWPARCSSSPQGPAGQGEAMAAQVLDSGRAWRNSSASARRRAGMRMPPVSRQQRPLLGERPGEVDAIDNRKIARLAKLAGAPDDKAAGIDLHVRSASA